MERSFNRAGFQFLQVHVLKRLIRHLIFETRRICRVCSKFSGVLIAVFVVGVLDHSCNDRKADDEFGWSTNGAIEFGVSGFGHPEEFSHHPRDRK